MEKASSSIRPDKESKEGSIAMVLNYNVSQWVRNESKEGGKLSYYANQWAQES